VTPEALAAPDASPPASVVLHASACPLAVTGMAALPGVSEADAAREAPEAGAAAPSQ
jgi:hypothetical protein